MIRRAARPLGRAVLALIALPAGAAAQQPVPDAAEPALIELRYATHVTTILSAIHHEGRIYIPVAEVFGHLRIDAEPEPGAGRVAGFFRDEARRYVVDAAEGVVVVGAETFAIPPDAAWATETDVYVLPSVLEAPFGLSWRVDLGRLLLRLTSEQPLPVAEAALRERQRSRAATLGPPPHAPLAFDRDRRNLAGGVVQYQATARTTTAGDAALDFGMATGAELLGGDLQSSFRGSLDDDGLALGAHRWRWRYAVDHDGLRPTQYLVGALAGAGLRRREIDGVRVTNAPLRPRLLLGRHTIEGRSEPEWEVELYVNDQLVDHTVADPAGHYSFDIPLHYGSAIVQLRHYGPSGQLRVEERRLDVPTDFVPRGRLEYEAGAGRESATGIGVAQASAAYGASDRVTTRLGVDWAGHDEVERPTLYAIATARLADNLLTAVETAPGVSTRLQARGAFPSHANVDVSWERRAPHALYNTTGVRDAWNAGGFLPLRASGVPITLRGRVGRADYASGRRVGTIDSYVAATLGPVRATLDYRLHRTRDDDAAPALRDELRAGVTLRPRLRAPWAPRGLLLNGALIYEPRHSRLGRIQAGLSGAIPRHGRINLGAEHNRATGRTRLDLRYQMDAPNFRSISSLAVHGGDAALNHTMRGTMGFDQGGVFAFSQREWAGGAGAVVRMFVDANGNGRYDPGEEIIDNVRVRFRHATAPRRLPSGLLRVEGLVPYYRYTVEIDESSIRNPYWVPSLTSFSFIADPNRYKRIDIPFEVGGIIEGRVIRPAPDGTGGAERPVGGVDVEIRGVDRDVTLTLRTFSDGSFYHLGIPPGRYEARLAAAHLERLGVRPEPAALEFQVRADPSGDFVRGLEIRLLPATEPEPIATRP